MANESDFLAELLDVPTGGARVVSENHNLDSINFQAALLDEAELRWKYSQAEIEAMRNDPARQEAAKKAAQERLNVDTSTGKVALVVASKAPWHGLGVNVDRAMTSEEAYNYSSLNWRVGKRIMRYRVSRDTNEEREIPNTYALVREDTGAFLATCGKVYKPFQNRDGFDLLDGVLEQFGARYESAGALGENGERVFIVARLPNQSFRVKGADEVDCFAAFTNPHTPGEAAFLFPTALRIECQNTYNTASRKAKGKGLRIPHRGDLVAKKAAAKEALGLAVKQLDGFKSAALAMADTRLPSIKTYANAVLDLVMSITDEDAQKGAAALVAGLAITQEEREVEEKRLEREIKKRNDAMEDILEAFHGPDNGIGGMRDTVWGGFNAFTKVADHGRRYKGTPTERASNRFESVLTGAADDWKQVAYSEAVKYLN